MSSDPVPRANLADVECKRRPQLPDGFRRYSTRIGAAFGAALTGLSVYELPPGQADDAIDMIVKRSSAVDDIAPWTSGTSEAEK
jgi:hypothetical protein